jgi:peptidoglycan/LPS O-acetylase OafA/YrhL
MLGAFRYVLAVLVTLTHLWPGLAGQSALAAVFGFYILSGYLMTNILQSCYGFSPRGLGRYAVNRFLRIFPTYWIVLLLAAAEVTLIPHSAIITNYKLSMPRGMSEWLPNVFIVGMLDGPNRAMIPPAWSLDIELVFYGLMAVGLSRARWSVTVWFLASLVYTGWLLWVGVLPNFRYATYPAASLPFAAGAVAYVYRESLHRRLVVPAPLAWSLLLLAVVASRLGWLGDVYTGGFYTTVGCCFLLLVSLNQFDAAKSRAWVRRLDRVLGNLAYPVFLCHWHVAAVVVHLVYDSDKPTDGYLWLWSFVFINLVGGLIYYLVDRNVDRLRDRVRGRPPVRPASLTA